CDFTMLPCLKMGGQQGIGCRSAVAPQTSSLDESFPPAPAARAACRLVQAKLPAPLPSQRGIASSREDQADQFRQTNRQKENSLMHDAVIVSAVRTPIGRANKGALKEVRADDLAAFAVKAALERLPQLDPSLVEDVILGCAFPEGEQGMNLARLV